MTPLRFERVPSRPLSLWQSAVAENARRQLELSNSKVSQTMVMQHPMVSAAAEHVTATYNGNPPTADRNLAIPHQRNVYISHLCYERVKAELAGDIAMADYLGTVYRQFSDNDPGFLTCASTYASYYVQYGGKFCYNDWTVEGGGNINYGVIDYVLPNDAVVAIIGDWGTGLDDAISMLKYIVTHVKPTAIIHLGDIYYSGTPSECETAFVQALEQAGAGNIPVFTLPGNHDYYALGYGFYPMLKQLNNNIPGAQQEASYFCLRTADGGYQFLGMDTGLNDSNPGDQINTAYSGPWLQPSEITWHQDKLDNFNGATILLSHHQLFSTNAKLNGSLSAYAGLPYLNPYLYQAFWPYFKTKVAAWIWGHEHNLALYQGNLLQLQTSVLLGSSAYEELTSANPYAQNYPQIPYDTAPAQWELGTNTDPNGVGYYNHAFAVLYFAYRKNPTDSIPVNYLQYPSWGPVAPSNPTGSSLVGVSYGLPTPWPNAPVQYGDTLTLFCQEALFISPLYSQIPYYYPTGTTNNPVGLMLTGSSGNVNHGDTVFIKTTEAAAGNYNVLGAWSTPTLYYYSGAAVQQQWQIFKKDTSNGTQINYGDAIYFVNKYYNQWLTPYWSRVYGNIYLSTRANANYYWQALQPAYTTQTE
jgi:3',5'-cyclic AMP phosphodiesterase CpdA